jgi:hypothetical protein
LTASLFYTDTFFEVSAILSTLTAMAGSFFTARKLFLLATISIFSVAAIAQTRPSNAREFKNLLEQAAQAREENRLAEAVELYRKALALRPHWTAAGGPWQRCCMPSAVYGEQPSGLVDGKLGEQSNGRRKLPE